MWFKVDDSLHGHPKVMAAGPAAIGLWTLAGAWSAKYLTDGFVPDHVLPFLCPDAEASASRLLRAGLWKRDDERGGYVFHDWSDYQLSSDRKRELREKRAEAGRKGGQVSGHTRRQKAARNEANGEANAEANASHGASHKHEAKTNPVPVPIKRTTHSPDGEFVEGGCGGESETAAPKAARASRGPTPRASRLPNDFTVTADMARWARENVPSVDIQSQTARFRDYWTAKSGKDATKLDWPATWRNWMRKAADDHRPPRAPNGARRNGMTVKEQRIAKLEDLLTSPDPPPGGFPELPGGAA